MRKQDTTALAVGARVFCTVHGAEGWHTVTAIRPRDGYIRITGFGAWCPPRNFTTVNAVIEQGIADAASIGEDGTALH